MLTFDTESGELKYGHQTLGHLDTQATDADIRDWLCDCFPRLESDSVIVRRTPSLDDLRQRAETLEDLITNATTVTESTAYRAELVKLDQRIADLECQ